MRVDNYKILQKEVDKNVNTSLAAKPGYISTPSSSAFSPNQRTN